MIFDSPFEAYRPSFNLCHFRGSHAYPKAVKHAILMNLGHLDAHHIKPGQPYRQYHYVTYRW